MNRNGLDSLPVNNCKKEEELSREYIKKCPDFAITRWLSVAHCFY